MRALRIINRRHDTAGNTVYDWRHYLAVLQRKPGGAQEWAQPFTELPEAFRRLQARCSTAREATARWMEILALVLHHDEQAVLAAVELARRPASPAKTHVLNVLHRLLDGKPAAPAPITAPQALRTVNSPRPMCCATTRCEASSRQRTP